MEFISTRIDQARNPQISAVIELIRQSAPQLGLEGGVIYYGWPKYTDYDAVRHPVDVAILSAQCGVVLIRVLSAANARSILEAAESLSQATAGAVSQLVRSARLRRNRQLKVIVSPLLYTPGFHGSDEIDVEQASSEKQLLDFLRSVPRQELTDTEIEEARSILEGAKALSRPTKRAIDDPEEQQIAVALGRLEEEIASFDAQQRQVALTAVGGPQRIRGLAGSGKTVILAMKAALAHLDNPAAHILVTYYTRSLQDHLKRLITRFHRHFGEGDPDWNRIHVHHGWGRKDLPGVHREASLRAGLSPMSYNLAVAGAGPKEKPFEYACRVLIESGQVAPYYDLVLIDEGQDFPDSFYQLCFQLAKGSRDEKQIVWAYDELQNVLDIHVRSPDELFGQDHDGQPRISLPRALPLYAETNDFVLSKCYRNQRDVLVLAHAIGFGIYGQPVQMLEDRQHWEIVGYDVERGDMRPGEKIEVVRPTRNSPTALISPGRTPLIQVRSFGGLRDEVSYCADEFRRFVDGGLRPEDLLAIAIDDRAAQAYLSRLAEELAVRGIASNNIIADKYSEPAFQIEGKVTLSTVYRAKGNEAAVVAVLGCDAVPLSRRSGRNRLFTAFTRSKGWLRITGMSPRFDELKAEIDTALALVPRMKFVMPDPEEIETIQRDLSEKDAKLQQARVDLDRLKEEHGLTDEDLQALLEAARPNGRR